MDSYEYRIASCYFPLTDEPLSGFGEDSDIYKLIEDLRDPCFSVSDEMGGAFQRTERIFFDRVAPTKVFEEKLRASDFFRNKEFGKCLKLLFLLEEITCPTFARYVDDQLASPIFDEALSDFRTSIEFLLGEKYKYAFGALRNFVELSCLQLIYAIDDRKYYYEDENERTYAVDLSYHPYKSKILPTLLSQGLITEKQSVDLKAIYSRLSSYSRSLNRDLYHGYLYFEPIAIDFPAIWIEEAARYLELIVEVYNKLYEAKGNFGHSCL